MVKETSMIETGVDKLVKIVKERKKIPVNEAAKQLGVGPKVVEEWADFLEEEGIISMEYKFGSAFLVERKFTKDEIKTKAKEVSNEKEVFVRKAESTLALIDKEGLPFQKFKKEFAKLKQDLGNDLKFVEAELKQLEKFEQLKNNVDKQIISHESDFRGKMDGFEEEIKQEEEKYSELLKDLDKEETKIDREKLEVLSLRQKELDLKNKLTEFKQNISKIEKEIDKENSVIESSEGRVKNIKELSEVIRKELTEKKQKGSELVKESTEHKKKILELQKSVLKKVDKNKNEITEKIHEGEVSTKKFREFFDKKAEIEELINHIDKEKDMLEYELIKLIKKAKAYDISSKSPKSELKEVSTIFENIKKKKDTFEKEVTKLGSLIKG